MYDGGMVRGMASTSSTPGIPDAAWSSGCPSCGNPTADGIDDCPFCTRLELSLGAFTSELPAILRRLADRLEEPVLDDLTIYDTNGNAIGRLVLS